MSVDSGHGQGVRYQGGAGRAGKCCREFEESSSGRPSLASYPFLTIRVQHDRLPSETGKTTEQGVRRIYHEYDVMLNRPGSDGGSKQPREVQCRLARATTALTVPCVSVPSSIVGSEGKNRFCTPW